MATNTTNGTDTALGYFTIIGKVEEADESSYERQKSDGTPPETVTRVQLSLVVPGMPRPGALRTAPGGGARRDTSRSGSWRRVGWWSAPTACAPWPSSAATPAPARRTSAASSSSATAAREATADERKQLQAARKAQKARPSSAAPPAPPRRPPRRRPRRGSPRPRTADRADGAIQPM